MAEIRNIAAIQIAGVVAYSPAGRRGQDRALSRPLGLRGHLIDTAIDYYQRRIVKRTTANGLIEFCVADAEHHAVGVLDDSLRFLTGVQ